MKRRTKLFVSLFFLCCLMLFSLSVSAADERLGQRIDGSLLTDGIEADTVEYLVTDYANGGLLGLPIVPYGQYFSNGSGHISIAGNRSVTISGSTSAYSNVSEIKVTLRLQRLEGNSWVTVNTLGPKTKYNANYVSGSGTYSVAGGYYYRVYGVHTVFQGQTSEAGASYTNGVWVS